MLLQIKIGVPQFAWYGDTELKLSFPPIWEIIVCEMKGRDAPRLTDVRMQNSFASPIGTPTISELARGRKSAVIIFDDLSRPTRGAELVPYVLNELGKGGITDEGITFVAGVGAHGAMKLMDFEKKLGREVVRKFPVYNHNPYENCTYLGTTSRNTPVKVNSEVMRCELKIAIGCIMPHLTYGFGGGAKLLVPGVAHMDTIHANHHGVAGRGKPTPGNPQGNLHPSVGFGKVQENIVRLDAEEAARMAGLDIIVNAVVNMKRETVGLFVGDAVAAHRAGARFAEQIYATPSPGPVDIVIANAYAKANEGMVAIPNSTELLKREGGDLVIICNTPEGQICHYASRSFGRDIGGCLWGPRTVLPPRVKRMIVLATYVDRAGLDWLGPPDSIIRCDSWDEVVEVLKETNGEGARVAVIPDATMQYFPDTL